MMHTCGISYEGDVLDLAMLHKIVIRSGAWFKYNDAHLGQGKEKARAYLVENPAVTEELKQKVLAAGGSETLLPKSAPAADEGGE